jgi:ribonucleoside-diphosphate reductase alpha chain
MMYTKDEALQKALQYYDGDALQAGVLIDKYALRDKQGNYYEATYEDVARRMAKEFARIEAKYPNPMSEHEILRLLTTGEGFVPDDVNIRCGVVGPQGSPMFGIGNSFQAVSLSNCSVIASPLDTMSGIMNTARDMANLYKRRFGVGVDISTLRPDGASVNNAAHTSTGAWSFADFFSYVTRMVGQAGRRGALMISIDVRHPDVEKFITMKKDLTKVTGANVSVRVTSDFMRAVEQDAEFTLQFPVNVPVEEATVVRTVRAKDIFTLIAETACSTAEPGVLFWDEITSTQALNSYVEHGFEVLSTNPCGEIPLPDADSCRLISVYLPAFVSSAFDPINSSWDEMALWEVVYKAQRLMDDMIDLEIEKLMEIRDLADTADERALFERFIEKCEQGRRTGLGTHGLGDMLARLTVAYGSDEALRLTDEIYAVFANAAYQSSIDLAKERGAFPIWNWETEKHTTYFARLDPEVLAEMQRVGRRNGSLLTNAPTGTRSLLSENCSSGIEPVFANYYTRRRKVDAGRDDTTPDFVDALGDAWKEFKVWHPNVQKFLRLAYTDPFAYRVPNAAELVDVTGKVLGTFEQFSEKAQLPSYFVTANDLDWQQRVSMQGTIQRWIDHSISSTTNLPKGTTPDVVMGIYLEAWKAGCKGITVYVDGSREAQVLTTDAAPTAAADPVAPDQAEPGTHCTGVCGNSGIPLAAEVRKVHRGVQTTGRMTKASFVSPIDGAERKVYVFVGLNDAEVPVEIFVTDERGDEDFHPYASALGRLASLCLKHGVGAEEVAHALSGLKGGSMSFRPGGMATSVPDLVSQLLREATGSRVNKAHTAALETGDTRQPVVTLPVADSRSVGSLRRCPTCKEQGVQDVGGCPICTLCGWTKCG